MSETGSNWNKTSSGDKRQNDVGRHDLHEADPGTYRAMDKTVETGRTSAGAPSHLNDTPSHLTAEQERSVGAANPLVDVPHHLAGVPYKQTSAEASVPTSTSLVVTDVPPTNPLEDEQRRLRMNSSYHKLSNQGGSKWNNRMALAVGLGFAVGLSAALVLRNKNAPAVDMSRHGFQRRDLETPVGRMAYFEAGVGPPMILLHGIGDGGNSYYWRWIAPMFTDRFRVIAPDLVGWGASEHPEKPVLFDTYIESIAALLEHTGKAIVVAESLSAGFAAFIAKRRPDLIDRLVLLSPAGGYDFRTNQVRPLQQGAFNVLAQTPGVNRFFYKAAFESKDTIEDWFEDHGFAEDDAIPSDLIDACYYSATQPGADYSALPFLTGKLRYDIAPMLADLKTPSIMLWGELENQIKPETRERIERVNPAIDLYHIPSARTCMQVEQPQLTADVINGFLARS